MKPIHQKALGAAASALLVAAPAIGFADSHSPRIFGQNASPGAYTPVTQSMMEHSPNNWLTYRGSYAGWDYSPLDQIDSKNVSKLKLAWGFNTGVDGAHEAPPIVNGRYMYVTTPEDHVIALDAKTGQELWSYKYHMPSQEEHLHPTNRGVALWGNNVYLATEDCKLVSLNDKTGKVNWVKQDQDWKTGAYGTLAPLAVKGKILMGCSGGETGGRGAVTAFNAKTGKRLWRTWMIPEPGQPGSNTWPNDGKGFYKHGGGSIWETGSYDPKTNITYWGTGNAGPWPANLRPGDNLYANSVVALNADTGKMVGYFQYDPNDAHDWDEISTPLLVTTELNGKKTEMAVHAARDGYIWELHRANPKGNHEKMKYIHAWTFSNNNTFKSINPKTGKVTFDPTKRPGTKHGAHYCPSAWGGKDWVPEAYSPKTKLLYVPALHGMCGYLPKGHKPTFKADEPYIGFPLGAVLRSITVPKSTTHLGELQAWNLKTHKIVWKHKFNHSFMWGPVLATGGSVVFAGGTVDRMFRAFDAKTGKVLWKFKAPAGIEGTPVAYKIDGTEYIAVQSGWGVDGGRILRQLNEDLGTNVSVPQSGTVLVFKLAG